MQKRLRGLFINTEKAICSIYESGKMSFDCLTVSQKYSLDYVEVSANKREINLGYDFYIFNYHWVQMGWLDTKTIKQLPGFKATIVLEMSQNSPFDCVAKNDFDAYLVLDPTCKYCLSSVYPFPRPLEVSKNPLPSYQEQSHPVIGTFGLSYIDKGFDEIVVAANKEFEKATVKINVPSSTNAPTKDLEDFKKRLTELKIRSDIKVEISNHYFDKAELINWCSQNTLNVFLYNRRIGNGLSATTDQAIASSRPLAISTNPTFRHIHHYIKPYPYFSLKESIEKSIPLVKKIQEDWSPQNFAKHFEHVLKENSVEPLQNSPQIKFELQKIKPILRIIKEMTLKQWIKSFIPPIVFKIRNVLFPRYSAPVLQPFAHQVLQSNSQFQEDLLIDLLLGTKKKGFYVDIGANDPFFNSNTLRFYQRGWHGINIEPCLSAFQKIAENRKRDINLNIAVSNDEKALTFYQIGNDSSLSTLDQKTAIIMAEAYKMKLITSTIDVLPLSKVFKLHAGEQQVDFLSVDAEGHDLAVLQSNDWNKYRPTLVMVESNLGYKEIIMFMDRNNYLFIYSNYVNALFVDKTTQDQNILDKISWNNQ